MQKQCIKCKEWKEVGDFRIGRGVCRACNRAYTQKWREENRDRNSVYKHSDRNRANSRAYYHRNKDRAKANAKQYRQLNKDKVNAKTHRRRAKKKGNGGSFTSLEWRSLCRKYRYRCLRCGKREPDIKLTVDHVLPIQFGGTNTIDNIQPLCGECNTSKGPRHIDYRPEHTGRSQVEQLSFW
jgi:5-methylcytosine-specific restriction endonuclease McrA